MAKVALEGIAHGQHQVLKVHVLSKPQAHCADLRKVAQGGLEPRPAAVEQR